MYLSEVKIKNFRGYGENPVRGDRFFVFDELDHDLVLFQGFNGHGKTSFFEAIEWCITDSVKRLERLYKSDYGGAYSAHELNRSHYLKFSPPASYIQGRPSENREVVVELTFDNGTKVTRTSISQILPISGRSEYVSNIVFTEEGQEPRQFTNEQLLNYLTQKSNSDSNFIKAHVLTQDGISDFLVRTSPEERKSHFMRFLQQEEMSRHIAQLRTLINGNNPLSRKRVEYEGLKSRLTQQQEQIDGFLRNIGYESINDYQQQFMSSYQTLTKFIKAAHKYPQFSLNLLNRGIITDSPDFVRALQSGTQVYELIKSEKTKLESRQVELLTIRAYVNKLTILQDAEFWIRKGNHARQLKDGDLARVQEEAEVINQDKESNDLAKKSLSERLNKAVEYSHLFEYLPQSIERKNKKIRDDLWELIKVEYDKFETFKREFTEENDQLSIWSEEHIQNWQEQYNKLTNDQSELSRRFNEIRLRKDVLTRINSQYQQALNQVKDYINSHSEAISSCPVCFNDDFSMNRYEGYGFNTDTPIPTALISIIDRTVINGDKEVEKLLLEESSLNGELADCNNKLAEIVVEPMLSWLLLLRQQFLEILQKVKEKLEQSQREVSRIEDQILQRKKTNSEQWERLRESGRFLFGEDVTLNDISISELDALLQEKNEWFQNHLKEIDFEHEPSLEELINKMIALRNEREVAAYFPDGLPILRKNEFANKRALLFASVILERLEELIKFKVPAGFEEYFSRYEQIKIELAELGQRIEYIAQLQSDVRVKYTELVAKQNQILGDALHGHPVISWVYRAINPHTQFKDLKVIVNDQGTHYTSSEIRENLYLDQIFSQSQLNILALSTFIGIGLTQNYSQLEQLFLDDPIQSLDDVNVLAFIDVLRAIIDSETNNKRLVLSTHDDNFAELLAIKMRNKNIMQYIIEGYGPEGPVVRKLSN